MSALQHRHTVSEVSDEMKSLIIEKNKMGLEEEPELLVKGESNSHNKYDTLHHHYSGLPQIACIYLL